MYEKSKEVRLRRQKTFYSIYKSFFIIDESVDPIYVMKQRKERGGGTGECGCKL